MPNKPTEAELAVIHEELVAYLDGELDSRETPRVERRLAEDEGYRARLKELQKAWDLLDNLPHAQVDPSFTQCTVRLITAQAEVEARHGKTQAALGRVLAGVLGLAAATVAAWGGYVLVLNYASGPNNELVKDLPLIENVDLYRSAESVEFLRSLEREGLFVQEVEDAT